VCTGRLGGNGSKGGGRGSLMQCYWVDVAVRMFHLQLYTEIRCESYCMEYTCCNLHYSFAFNIAVNLSIHSNNLLPENTHHET